MGELLSPQSVAVDGSVNFRDFGGYASEDGRRVRTGRLFRCGTLTYVTEQGMNQFHALGIDLICDLRRPDEREDQPTPLPDDTPKRLEIPIDPGSATVMRERLGSSELSRDDRIAFMTALTGELTREHAADYTIMFEHLLDIDDGGFVVHCSAGKDRTGVACMLILHALGVPRDAIVQDYLLTNTTIDYEGYVLRRMMPRLAERHGQSWQPVKEDIMALAGVHPTYIEAAYDGIEAEHDGIDHYLRDALGLTDRDLQHLRERYLA